MRTSRRRVRRNAALKAKTELGIWDAIGAVRSARPSDAKQFLPKHVWSEVVKGGPGLYAYGTGKNGEVLRKFKSPSLGGVLTSTRIAASKSHEFHWLIDVQDKYPVVIRIFDDKGKTVFRVEEYAQAFVRVPVMVEVKRKRTSRAR